jgi:hypothetical protein
MDKLPRELRDKIYSEVFRCSNDEVYLFRDVRSWYLTHPGTIAVWQSHIIPSQFAVNQQYYAESTAFFFKLKTVRYDQRMSRLLHLAINSDTLRFSLTSLKVLAGLDELRDLAKVLLLLSRLSHVEVVLCEMKIFEDIEVAGDAVTAFGEGLKTLRGLQSFRLGWRREPLDDRAWSVVAAVEESIREVVTRSRE